MDDFSIISLGILVVAIIVAIVIFWLYSFNIIFGKQGMTFIIFLVLISGIALIAFSKKK